MSIINGKELKPCREMHTRTDKDGMHVNLITHCNHPLCREGCFTSEGDCKDFIPSRRISRNIRWIASLIERHI